MIVKPRLTDHYEIPIAQASVDFAIPFLDEDIPLYVDPFLLWKSPSMMDKALHQALISGFNDLGRRFVAGDEEETIGAIVAASECNEVGLGVSGSRRGRRIGERVAREILELFNHLDFYRKHGIRHIEELQLLVEGISKDRISDFVCTFAKSFLIDFTTERCQDYGIPTAKTEIDDIYDMGSRMLKTESAEVPVHPKTGAPILFVPKRWLRHVPWIGFDDYFRHSCPQDDIAHEGEDITRIRVLRYNRNAFGVVDSYIQAKELSFGECKNDPLFGQIPILSARRTLKKLQRLPTGLAGGADKKFESAIERLLPSLLYPHLDFAAAQSRTDAGTSIRDLLFYNPAEHRLLKELFDDYGARQVVVEMKNVQKVEREHIDQVNRYLSDGFSRFGILVTRNPLTKAMRRRTIDLWSGQRKVIVPLIDQDIEQMVEVFESKNREPIDVVARSYAKFRRECPQ